MPRGIPKNGTSKGWFKKGHKINLGKKNHLGFKHSEETKKIIREKSVFQKGFIPWDKGIPRPEETRNKISKTNKEKGIEPKIKFISYKENHWNWKGGITPENRKLRNGLEYKIWREKIFKRDNYTCQKYEIEGCYLHPHHIQNFAEYPELRFAIDNGITLSKKAHDEFHKIYGKNNNTREQLEEFLKK